MRDIRVISVAVTWDEGGNRIEKPVSEMTEEDRRHMRETWKKNLRAAGLEVVKEA